MSGSGSVARGARFGTVRRKSWAATSPSGSVAVTVIVATPGEIAPTVTSSPATLTAATPTSVVSAPKVSESWSGSVKYPATRIATWSPVSASASGIATTTRGARFGTVTAKPWVAVAPSGSVAVTVTVAEPLTTATSVATAPANSARTTAVFEDIAVKERASPSGSVKCADRSRTTESRTTCCGIGTASLGEALRSGGVEMSPSQVAIATAARAASISRLVPNLFPALGLQRIRERYSRTTRPCGLEEGSIA